MTHEGRMLRGKANFDSGRFPNNSETLYYLEQSKQETDVDYSSMLKKDLITAAEKNEITLTGKETKDDLIVLLENKSDEAPEEEAPIVAVNDENPAVEVI